MLLNGTDCLFQQMKHLLLCVEYLSSSHFLLASASSLLVLVADRDDIVGSHIEEALCTGLPTHNIVRIEYQLSFSSKHTTLNNAKISSEFIYIAFTNKRSRRLLFY